MMFLPTTELRNPASEQLDQLTALGIVQLMNAEDAKLAAVVATQAEPIAQAIEVIADRFRRGGRLIYMGAGTSGRLGVLDASECPPTFNSPPEQVVGLIAGGPKALTTAIEGAEDVRKLAVEDLDSVKLTANDVVVGIASSGTTPYVLQALEYARQHQAVSVGLSCSQDSPVSQACDIAITPVSGPEVVSGSTRLKAGTVTKMILNMLTTGSMVLIGKTYGNLMVDLRATNIKLVARTARIVSNLTNLSIEESSELLDRSSGELKTAVVMHHRQVDANTARQLLKQTNGHLRSAVEHGDKTQPNIAYNEMVLGIDGGGTGTTAILGRREADGTLTEIGRGEAGASNPRALGFAQAFAAIDQAIQQAFQAANLPRGEVSCACFAIAGAARESEQTQIAAWVTAQEIAKTLTQVHDALPVLAAASDDLTGIALISGTGSLAYGQDSTGASVRSGGWGYLIGDEGSAYALVNQALRAVTGAADGRAPETQLTTNLLSALNLADISELVPAVYTQLDRTSLAALAPIVLETADRGDQVAEQLVSQAAHDLAQLVSSVAGKLTWPATGFVLAVTGGVLTGSPVILNKLQQILRQQNLSPSEVRIVTEPAVGALKIASQLNSATTINANT